MIQRKDTYDVDGNLVQREELEPISGVLRYRRWNADRVLVEERPATPEEMVGYDAWRNGQNEQEVRRQAEASLERNKDFLALDPPTNAQNAAQIIALTKQINGIIRTALDLFDDIEDSVQ